MKKKSKRYKEILKLAIKGKKVDLKEIIEFGAEFIVLKERDPRQDESI